MYRLSFGFLIGICFVTLVLFHNSNELSSSLVDVVLSILMIGLLGMIIAPPIGLLQNRINCETIKTIEKLNWQLPRLRILLFFGLIFGSLFGLVCYWSAETVPKVSLVLVGVVILNEFMIKTEDIMTRNIPNEGIVRSLKNALLIMFITSLIVGLPFGIVGGLMFDEGMQASLIFGLFLGIYIGLSTGLEHGGFACFQYLVLRFFLWRNGFAPWRYVRFLDYAAERVFLRKVGGGYIFVHRMLLDYFAALYSSPPTSPSKAPVNE